VYGCFVRVERPIAAALVPLIDAAIVKTTLAELTLTIGWQCIARCFPGYTMPMSLASCGLCCREWS
jgi:hypothetical protein